MSAARRQMVHRCTIQRDMQSGRNPFGQKDVPQWTNYHVNLPCYIYSTVTSSRNPDTIHSPQRTTIIDQVFAIVPKGTDVNERDRLVVVTDRLGVEYMNSIFRILGVNVRRNHLELYLERYTDSVNG